MLSFTHVHHTKPYIYINPKPNVRRGRQIYGEGIIIHHMINITNRIIDDQQKSHGGDFISPI